MKVLITGSEGFIGSHLTEKLISLGYNVTALVQYNSFGNIGNLKFLTKDKIKNCNIEFADIRDEDKILKLGKNKDIIIHLAALISIPYSYSSYKSFIDTNINGTVNILRCLKKNNNTKLIHTSTSEVYGTAQKIPMDESHRIYPQSPYAASKASADLIVNSFYNSFNLPIITLRPFNTFGPRQSPRAIIPTIIKQFIENKKNLTLGNINTGRDFTYVEDTVDAFKKALKSKKFGETFNIGSNFSTKVSNIIKLISSDFNENKKVLKNSKKIRPNKSEVLNLYSANHKAIKLLKWKPKHSGMKGFKIALKKTIKWYKENYEIFNECSNKLI